MKKLLSAVLATLLLLSCMATASLAIAAIEQPDDYEEILIPTPDENGGGAGLNSWVSVSPMEQDDIWGMGKTYEKTQSTAHVVMGYCPSSPIDITGMEQLEFDVYVSDDTTLAKGHTTIELNSTLDQGGYNRRDKNELEVNMNGGWKLQAGWNHVIYSLTDSFEASKGTFDPKNFNCFTIVRHSGVTLTGEEPFIISVANVKFTKGGLTQEEIDAAVKAEFEETHSDLIAKVAELHAYQSSSDITKDNYEQVKAKIASAQEMVDLLNEEEKAIWDRYDYGKDLKNAALAVEKYEEKQESIAASLESHKELVATINGFPTTLNKDNYEKTKEDVEAARKTYDNLARTPREDLEIAGILAKLEAAEKLVNDYVPTEEPGDNTGEPTDQKPASGCASALSIGAGAMLLLAGAWVGVNARKKEN